MKNKFKSILPLTALLTLSLVFQHCDRSEQNVSPVISNEGLTTVTLTLVNVADAADTPNATWEQLLDKNGKPLPADVSKAKLTLRPNAVYNASIAISDKSQVPPTDVTDEIKTRSQYHILFYQPLPASTLIIPHSANELYPEPIPTPIPAGAALPLTVEVTDKDGSNPPLALGLATKFTTGAAGNGWLQVVLRHQPAGKDGTYTPGTTDMNVGFSVSIQ